MYQDHSSTTISPPASETSGKETLSLASRSVAQQDALKVMSFNIRNSAADDGPHCWANRRELAFEILKVWEPDLIGFQEVLSDQFEDIRSFATDYGLSGVARDDGQHHGERALIAYRHSRFTLVDSGDFWLAEAHDRPQRGWDASHIRVCSWVRLLDRESKRPLLFANTHWDHQGVLARHMSARLMRRKLTELARGTAVIVTGDFNSHETDDWIQQLLDPAAGGVALTDSYRHVHPQRRPDEKTDHHFTDDISGMRIDYVLHCGQFHATDAQIIRTRGADGKYPTDHFPVISVLEWRRPDRVAKFRNS